MSIDGYVSKIGEQTRRLTKVEEAIGHLHNDLRDARTQAVAEGNDVEVKILDELMIFIASAALATEEALRRLTLYGEWIQDGATYDQMPTEAEVF
jgi:alanine-alpha-ketoisovalerate/valine-pyruvate aminotransferase